MLALLLTLRYLYEVENVRLDLILRNVFCLSGRLAAATTPSFRAPVGPPG